MSTIACSTDLSGALMTGCIAFSNSSQIRFTKGKNKFDNLEFQISSWCWLLGFMSRNSSSPFQMPGQAAVIVMIGHHLTFCALCNGLRQRCHYFRNRIPRLHPKHGLRETLESSHGHNGWISRFGKSGCNRKRFVVSSTAEIGVTTMAQSRLPSLEPHCVWNPCANGVCRCHDN